VPIEHGEGGPAQLVDQTDEPRVQQTGQRPLRTVQLGRELVAARDGAIAELVDESSDRTLVIGVAHRELRADGERIDGRRVPGDGIVHCDGVERIQLFSV